MMISIRHRTAYLAMPKTGSTSVESVLKRKCEIQVAGQPKFKHLNYRRYARYFEKMLESFDVTDMESVCMFREPVEWLMSWYRYRARDDMKAKGNSTKGLTFEQFIGEQLSADKINIGNVGTQAYFVSDKAGKVGVTRIFKYENFPAFADYLSERFKRKLEFPQLNVSPPAEIDLSPELRRKLEQAMAEDFRIYHDVAR